VNEMDGRLRDLLEAAAGVPPHRVDVEAVRRRVVRRRVLEGVAAAAAVAVLAVAIPVAAATAGHSRAAPRPQTHPPRGPVAYVISSSGTMTPIATATNTPGKPITAITAGRAVSAVAITPDGKTVYVANVDAVEPPYTPSTVTPVATATGTRGKPITVGNYPEAIAITPDGKTAYVLGSDSSTVTPIATATNTPGKPIKVRNYADAFAITPDGKTVYVASSPAGGSGTVTPIATATNTPGKPITVGNGPLVIAITPDGKTAYVVNYGSGTVTPIATATNTPGEPIKVGADPYEIVFTPDGKTAYVGTGACRPAPGDWGSCRSASAVTPIATATNTPGKPITTGATPEAMAITPDGQTVYVASLGACPSAGTLGPENCRPALVTPIATATNTPGQPITVGPGPFAMAITPDGKTVYVLSIGDCPRGCRSGLVTPISTATHTPGKPITVGGPASWIVFR
jgi:YVTN family beta-propeller protein